MNYITFRDLCDVWKASIGYNKLQTNFSVGKYGKGHSQNKEMLY